VTELADCDRTSKGDLHSHVVVGNPMPRKKVSTNHQIMTRQVAIPESQISPSTHIDKRACLTATREHRETIQPLGTPMAPVKGISDCLIYLFWTSTKLWPALVRAFPGGNALTSLPLICRKASEFSSMIGAMP
jgi:hypothetical protein